MEYLELVSKKVEELSELKFKNQNENFKNILISLVTEGKTKNFIKDTIKNNFQSIENEIQKNSNVQMLIKNRHEDEAIIILDELISDLKKQTNLKKLESLEKKLINNLDENSYTELVELKSQINRD